MKQKALFFLRHYNDIDHIVPVIYKWLESERGVANVVVTSYPNIMDDFRINFLKQFDNIRIHFIDDFLSAERRREKERTAQIDQMYRYHPMRIVAKIRSRFFNPSSQDRTWHDSRSWYDASFMERMLDEVFGDSKSGIVVFDWIHKGMNEYLDFAHKVMRASKNRGFTIISLPHGDSPHYNQMLRRDEIDYSSADIYSPIAMFDFLVVPNELCAKRYRPHLERDRIKVLGSPRYNDEWLSVMRTLLPAYDARKAEGKLKIVFFLRHFGYPIFWEEVVRSIKLITQFPEVYLIVKHHTRSIQLQRLIQAYPELGTSSLANLEIVYDEVHSNSLVQWADVVVDVGTSVAFEAIKLGKPVLAMEYLHATYSTIAHYMPSCVMWCRDHLYDTIQALIENQDHQFYNEEERKRFIQEIIDVPDTNVLVRYVQFLEHCLKKER